MFKRRKKKEECAKEDGDRGGERERERERIEKSLLCKDKLF